MKICFVLCISRYFSVRTRSRSRTRSPYPYLVPVPRYYQVRYRINTRSALPVRLPYLYVPVRYNKRDCIIRENNNIEQQERTRNIFLSESWNINGIIRRYRTVQVKTVPGHLTAIFNYYIFRGIDSSLEVQLLPRAFFSRT